jgi:hypothetical protein
MIGDGGVAKRGVVGPKERYSPDDLEAIRTGMIVWAYVAESKAALDPPKE